MRVLSTVCVFLLALALGSCADAPTASLEVESGTITAAAAKIVLPAPGTFVQGASGKGAVRHIPARQPPAALQHSHAP